MTETITHIAASKLTVPKKPFKALDGIRLSVDREGCLVVDAPDITDKLIYTNDIVDMHDSQNFTYLGRRDNVINSGEMEVLGSAEHCKIAVCKHPTRPIRSVQFHPEAVGSVLEYSVECGDMTK